MKQGLNRPFLGLFWSASSYDLVQSSASNIYRFGIVEYDCMTDSCANGSIKPCEIHEGQLPGHFTIEVSLPVYVLALKEAILTILHAARTESCRQMRG